MCQVEGFDEVERAFVHVDYERRNEPEHKASSNLPLLYCFFGRLNPFLCADGLV